VYDCIQKFLQFQLTVNCAILAISLIVIIGSGAEEKDHPLPVTQMLWLNLIMDSLAALALASEPPSNAQLKRPPVNRSAPIITVQMVWNMLGQAAYQVMVVCYIFFDAECIPDWRTDLLDDDGTRAEGPYTYHYTVIFNTFVLMQLFNQYNSRFLQGEWNILAGVTKNKLFLGISFTTMGLQVLMAQFAGKFLKIHDYPGLTGNQWLMCLGFAIGPIFWQLFINLAVRGLSLFHTTYGLKGLSEALKFKSKASTGNYRTQSTSRQMSRLNSSRLL
jgi:magnesium-transporting ATPase (P-type)